MIRSLLVAAAVLASAADARKPVVHRSMPLSAEAAIQLADTCTQPNMRPPPSQRLFYSSAVEQTISSLVPKFKDPNLAQIFSNTLPNVLDTTVYSHVNRTGPGGVAAADTFIITGDIPAMWLRDSTNQVWPFLRFAKQDPAIADLIVGVIRRQTRSVLIDPYANAFQQSVLAGQGPHADDETYKAAYAGTTISAMTPDIFERKYELDSLANTLRLASAYYNATGDVSPFDTLWVQGVQTILDVMVTQQQDTAQEDDNGGPAYTFQRTTDEPSDSLEHGRGSPAKYTGLIKSGFRGSDDALMLPYNIPENAFAAVSLRAVASLLTAVNQPAVAAQALSIASQVEAAIASVGIFTHPVAGRMYAYELDGFGNYYTMDDANIPGLLSMPYYGFVSSNDSLYLNTRSTVLSAVNPYFYNGTAAAGIGGPHNGPYFVWPMALISQAWTSNSDTEIASLLSTLVQSTACTGLIHESFDRNSFFSFTRPWFAWVNSYFADLILKIADERPYLIFN